MILPTRTWYPTGATVEIEVDAAEGAAELVVRHLAREVARVDVPAGGGIVAVGSLPRGGYGVDAVDADGTRTSSTAVDVLDDAFERPRYGFVVTMTDDAPVAEVRRFYRRMHLNLAQFYDWAYKHSTLMPPERSYVDPLGQPRTLDGVDALAATLEDVGTVPLGYSAVYAVGADEVGTWDAQIIRREDGEPYRLGENFLVLLDPSDPVWLKHYTHELEAVLAGTRLRGFHLDQYGWPKYARTRDRRVDLAAAYRRMLDVIGERVPQARTIFNNVNDFGTTQTAGAPQDATYIEVWSPHDTLGDLSDLVERTRRLRPEHPPIMSAYLSCLVEDEAAGVEAARLVMASVYGAGGTHLLLGEDSNALTDPYYPRNARLTAASVDVLADWYDFVVRYGDLLLDPGLEDVTEFYTGGINEDVVLDGAPASTRAEPGTVWVRVRRLADGAHVVHLVNLLGLEETAWDHGKPAPTPLTGLRLRVANGLLPAGATWASPDDPGAATVTLSSVDAGSASQSDALSAGQEHAALELPALVRWAVVHLPATPAAG